MELWVLNNSLFWEGSSYGEKLGIAIKIKTWTHTGWEVPMFIKSLAHS